MIGEKEEMKKEKNRKYRVAYHELFMDEKNKCVNNSSI